MVTSTTDGFISELKMDNNIYERETKSVVENANFLNGERKCQSCGFMMERMPMNTSFRRVDTGKIIFEQSKNGVLYRFDGDVDWRWCCVNCSASVLPKLK